MEDKIVLIMILAACILPLIVIGIIFLNGKGSFLIAGFNTKSPEEKSDYDIAALCKFLGKIMFALSFTMLLWIFSAAYDKNSLFVLGLILFIGIIAFTLIYINTNNRFKKTE